MQENITAVKDSPNISTTTIPGPKNYETDVTKYIRELLCVRRMHFLHCYFSEKNVILKKHFNKRIFLRFYDSTCGAKQSSSIS